MAVDTRDKRSSALGFIQPGSWLFPNPDGSLANAADRRHAGHVYAGELAVSVVPAGFVYISSARISLPQATGIMAVP